MRKRILHVISSLDHGGAERQLLLNLSRLDSTRFDHLVCCVQREGKLADQAGRMGIPVYVLNVRRKFQIPTGVWRLKRLVQDLDVDLIHSSLVDADILSGLAGRLTGVPVVSSLVSRRYVAEALVDNPRMTRWKARLMRTVISTVYRRFHSRHIAVSGYIRWSAIEDLKVPANKVTVIYRALPESWFEGDATGASPDPAVTSLVEGAYPLLINVGRLVPQKGQRYLLLAFSIIAQSLSNARLLIAGDGPLRKPLTELRDELGLQDKVFFLGTRDDVRSLLDIADMFVFSSLVEGIPNAVIEASGAGKPTVASNIGPLPEVVNDGVTGVLVQPRSPQELANAVITLARNPDRLSAMGRAARDLARERFSISRTVQQMEALYDSVISSPRHAIAAPADPRRTPLKP